MTADPAAGYRLVDVGGAARLEWFGARLVDRPSPAALGPRSDPERWLAADLRFDRETGWSGPAVAAGPWPIAIDDLTLELRATETGQVGLFPEHVTMLPWLRERVTERAAAVRADGRLPPSVLHLFAYTGLATLASAAAGAAVAHVDASRPAVAWARQNADRSALADRPVRWIVDDAMAFSEREIRREKRYAGVVLDPPSFGHGPGGRDWRIEGDLRTLLAAVAGLLEPDGFVLLTAHTPGFDGERLAGLVRDALRRRPAAVEAGDLALTSQDGRRLELGAFARTSGGS
ncbi:MAG: class I SAM-dependent methyltransferase [Chloroflexota bacterium]